MLSASPSCWAYALGRSPSFGPCLSPAKHAISKRFVVSFGRVAGGSRRRNRAGGSKCRCRFSSRLSFAPRSARAAILPAFLRLAPALRSGGDTRGALRAWVVMWRASWRVGCPRGTPFGESKSAFGARDAKSLASARRSEGALRVKRRTKRRQETAERPPRPGRERGSELAESARRVLVCWWSPSAVRSLAPRTWLSLVVLVLFHIPRALRAPAPDAGGSARPRGWARDAPRGTPGTTRARWVFGVIAV